MTHHSNPTSDATKTIPNLNYMEGFRDRPTPRPNIDVVRAMRHSPRSREEVQLALSAIWELYHFIDGVGTKRECLERNLDFMHLLYERYLETDFVTERNHA